METIQLTEKLVNGEDELELAKEQLHRSLGENVWSILVDFIRSDF